MALLMVLASSSLSCFITSPLILSPRATRRMAAFCTPVILVELFSGAGILAGFLFVQPTAQNISPGFWIVAAVFLELREQHLGSGWHQSGQAGGFIHRACGSGLARRQARVSIYDRQSFVRLHAHAPFSAAHHLYQGEDHQADYQHYAAHRSP